MKKAPSYFCPDDGWEGSEAVCPICGQPSESLEVEEGHRPAQPQLEDDQTVSPDFEPLDDFEEETPAEEREEEY